MTAPALTSLHILSQTGFFSRLTGPQLQRIATHCELQEFAGGTPVYSLGDPAVSFYVLVEGMVRFTLSLGSRQASAGQIIRRGEVFGWAALVETARRRIATASCITACTVLALDGEHLLEVMAEDHSVGYHVMKELNSLITGNMIAFAAG